MIRKRLGFEQKQQLARARGCGGAPASPAKTKTKTEDEKQASSNQTQMEVEVWGLVLGNDQHHPSYRELVHGGSPSFSRGEILLTPRYLLPFGVSDIFLTLTHTDRRTLQGSVNNMDLSRSKCGCLDQKYSELRLEPKMGKCEYCLRSKERKRLKTCTQCGSFDYCSSACQVTTICVFAFQSINMTHNFLTLNLFIQRADWPEHKKLCQNITYMNQCTNFSGSVLFSYL